MAGGTWSSTTLTAEYALPKLPLPSSLITRNFPSNKLLSDVSETEIRVSAEGKVGGAGGAEAVELCGGGVGAMPSPKTQLKRADGGKLSTRGGFNAY
jgi:hypothetical protein